MATFTMSNFSLSNLAVIASGASIQQQVVTGASGGTVGSIESTETFVYSMNTSNMHVLAPINSWTATIMNNTTLGNTKLVACDTNRNIYFASSYTGSNTILFDAFGSNNVIVPFATSNSVACVAKFNQTGNAQWMVNVVGSNLSARSLDVDTNGNVYFACSYTNDGPVIYNANGSIAYNVTVNVSGTGGGSGNMLIKYNSSGLAQWFVNAADNIGAGASALRINTISVNSITNSVYASYYLAFQLGNLYLNNSNVGRLINHTTDTNAVRYFSVLTSYNMDNGVLQWRMRTTENSSINSIATDTANNLYLAGTYKGSTTIFNNSNVQVAALRGTSTSAAYLIKTTPSGVYTWNATCDGGGENDNGLTVVSDSLNNVYIGGRYGTVTMPVYNSDIMGSNVAFTFSQQGSDVAWLVKYNSNGLFNWGTCVNSAGSDSGQFVQVDSLRNVYLAGTYNGQATVFNASNVSAGSGFTMSNSSGQGIFVTKWNESGIAQQNIVVDGVGTDSVSGFVIARDNTLVVRGRFSSSNAPNILINGSNIGLIIPAGTSNNTDYIAKINPDVIPTYYLATDLTQGNNGLIKTFLNPTMSNAVIRIMNSNDNTVLSSATVGPLSLKKYMWYSRWYDY